MKLLLFMTLLISTSSFADRANAIKCAQAKGASIMAERLHDLVLEEINITLRKVHDKRVSLARDPNAHLLEAFAIYSTSNEILRPDFQSLVSEIGHILSNAIDDRYSTCIRNAFDD